MKALLVATTILALAGVARAGQTYVGVSEGADKKLGTEDRTQGAEM